MLMIMNQEHKIRIPNSKFQSLFKYLISWSMAVFMIFLFILWCLWVDFYGFSISNISFNLGRIHMFFLCNGIVLILLKSSLLSVRDEGDGDEDQNLMYMKKKKENFEKAIDEKHAKEEEIVVNVEEEEDHRISNGSDLIAVLKQIDQPAAIEEEEEKDEFEELSVDELNKKCDEFIRRMRSDICNSKGVF